MIFLCAFGHCLVCIVVPFVCLCYFFETIHVGNIVEYVSYLILLIFFYIYMFVCLWFLSLITAS